jgi:hypothetical protein
MKLKFLFYHENLHPVNQNFNFEFVDPDYKIRYVQNDGFEPPNWKGSTGSFNKNSLVMVKIVDFEL